MKDIRRLNAEQQEIIVFSHLRWEFVKQRPQHLIERFARNNKVLFVEEPIGNRSGSSLTARELLLSKNLMVIQPNIDSLEPKAISSIVSQYMSKLRMNNPILWFYSALFVDVSQYLSHKMVIYDCMDELSAFLGAPVELLQKESELLEQADIVFTGGHSLYEAKKNRHQNVFSFPSSVEKEHFNQAYKKETQIPDDLCSIPRPIAGFYGVIDERIDLSLISFAAKALPQISFVFLGPVVKINPDSLPKEKNIHYLGQKTYDTLPQYLKGFDMAIMPFALNEATRYISPTKTLEFMSALKPIISTPIHDVVHDFSHEVTIASTNNEFVKAIQFYEKEPIFHKIQRHIAQGAAVKRSSWDKTVMNMQNIITQADYESKNEAVDEQFEKSQSHVVSYV